MTKKQIIRMVAFILATCGLLYLLCDAFEMKNTATHDKRATTFRSLEENTLDAVWIGTSGVDRYWIAGKAYEEYGMTVYPYSSDAMPVWLYLDRIKEVYDTQNPKLIILDIRAFTQGNNDADVMETRARRVLDALPGLSSNHLKTALKTMELLHSVDPERNWFDLSLLLSFVKYHSMWEEDDYSLTNHLGDVECIYGGFWVTKSSVRARPQKIVPYSTKRTAKLDDISEQALYNIIEYAQENNISLLFVDTPQYKLVKQNRRSNTVYQILDEYGMDYINYCLVDKNNDNKFLYCPEISNETDFYIQGHVNYYGAEKFTAIFAKYLDENYDFDDHRNDENVKKDWDAWYDNIKAYIAKKEQQAGTKPTQPQTEPTLPVDSSSVGSSS